MFLSFLKSELFRVSKMVSTYVLPVIMCIMVLITSVILLKVDVASYLGMSRDDYDAIVEQGNSVGTISDSFEMGFQAGYDAGESFVSGEEEEGLVVAEPYEELPSLWGKGLFYYEDVEALFNQNVAGLTNILLVAIFVGIYIGDCYKHKFDKNLVIACKNRGVITAVRMTVIALYSLFIQCVTWIASLICAALMAESVKVNVDKASVLYFIITFLIVYAFGLLIMFITNLTKSKAAGITVGVVLASGLLSIVMSLASMILINLLKIDSAFSFADYTLSQNLTVLTLDSDGKIVIRALLCAIIYAVLASVANYVVIKKRDIS